MALVQWCCGAFYFLESMCMDKRAGPVAQVAKCFPGDLPQPRLWGKRSACALATSTRGQQLHIFIPVYSIVLEE